MDAITIPYYNKRQTYSIQYFESHKSQKIMALFLSKPELYSEIHKLPASSKQAYFFNKFRKFLELYETFSSKDFDGNMYFNDLSIDKLGSVNVCGGGGSRSNSGRNYLIQQYKIIQENNTKTIEYFKEKYGIEINTLVDNRVFVGVKEPWKNPSPAMVAHMKDILAGEYSDLTLESPIPEYLDKDLVPLKIRNKACQKWLSKHKSFVPEIISKINQEEIDALEEEKFLHQKKSENDPSVSNVVFVAPVIDDDEW
jgi:hypothetical protein